MDACRFHRRFAAGKWYYKSDPVGIHPPSSYHPSTLRKSPLLLYLSPPSLLLHARYIVSTRLKRA
jgi:hypothetical protein